MNILTTTAVLDKPDYYSVSALKTYKRCGLEYYHKYIDKINKFKMSTSTLLGNLLHDALELYYSPDGTGLETLKLCLYKTAEDTFRSTGVIPINTAYNLVDELLNELYSLANDVCNLHKRADINYKGKDAIRKKDGGVSTSYQSTTAWKSAEKGIDGDNRRARINYLIQYSINPNLDDVDVISAYSEAVYIADSFVNINNIKKVRHVELPFSQYDPYTGVVNNLVNIPNGDKLIHGFIDLVAEVSDGLAIIDYKSSKTAYTEEQVRYNVQLYTYVYAYKCLTGEDVKYIGIYNIRAGNLVLVPIDTKLMNSTLNNFFKIHDAIKANIFIGHTPEDSYSPCLNCFGKACAYIDICHPSNESDLLELYRLTS